MSERKDVNEDFDLASFDLDDFDFGEPLQTGEVPKDDRSPVTEIAEGALKGVKETAKDPSFYINSMRKALPDGYGAAYDVANDVTNKGLGLYNEVVQDLRPGVRDLKRIMRRAKSSVETILPDGLSKKLDGWLEEKEREGSVSQNQESIQDSQITRDLAEIFQKQAEDKEEDKVEGLVRETIRGKRFESQSEQLDDIRRLLTKEDAYRDTVMAKYHQKSLEMQYRSFFAQRDLLEITKASTSEFLTLFRNIQKNTAYPDIVKMRNTELFGQLTKERLIGVAQDKSAPMAREFLNKLTDQLGSRFKERTDEFKDAVAQFAFAADQAEMLDGMEDMGGPTKGEMAGEMAGDTFTRWLGERVGKKLRPHIEANEKVAGIGNKLLYGAENYNTIIKEQLENATFTSGIGQMFQDAALSALRIRREPKVGFDDIASSTEPVPFDNLARKSIVEIIPGWLARINQSINGGIAPLETFDHERNQYVSVDALSDKIANTAVSEDQIDRMKSITSDIMSKLDAGGTLDPEVKDRLELLLLKQSRNDVRFDPKRYLDSYALTRDGFTDSEADEIAELFRSRFKLDLDGKMANDNVEGTAAQVEISRDLRRLRESIPNVYEYANIQANTANREALRRAGVVKNVNGEDFVDDQYIYDRFSGKNKRGESSEPTASEDAIRSSMVRAGERARDDYEARIAASDNSAESFELLNETLIGFKEDLRTMFDAQAQTGEREYQTQQFDRLIESVVANSAKRESKEAIEVLSEILDAVRNIEIVQYNGEPPEFDKDSFMDKAKRRGATYRDRAKDFFLETKQHGGRLINKYVTNPIKGTIGAVRGQIGMVTNTAKMFNDRIKSAGQTVGTAMRRRRAMDVYVPGFKLPKLEKLKMESGHYKDALTGKVIRTVADIKGPVMDALTGNIVLSADDLERGLFDVRGKSLEIKGIKSFLANKVAGVVGFATDQVQKVFSLPTAALGKGKRFLQRSINPTPDVYVPGEQSPRIYSHLLRRGHYVSSKSGKVIKHLSDIDSDVMDRTGKIVLSLDELSHVVDYKGEPITSLFGRVLRLGGKAFDAAVGIGKRVLKGTGNAVRKAIDFGGDLASAAVGKVRGAGRMAREALVGKMVGGEVLDDIYRLLVKYFQFKGMDIKDFKLGKRKTDEPGAFKRPKPRVRVRAGEKPEQSKSTTGIASEKLSEIRGGISAIVGKAMGLSDDEIKERLKDVKTKAGSKARSIKDRVSQKAEDLQERSNSWRNIMERRKKKADSVKDKTPRPKRKAKKSQTGGILGLLGSAVGLLKGIVSGIGSLVGAIVGGSALDSLMDGVGDFMGDDAPDREKQKGKGKGRGRTRAAKGKAGMFRRAAQWTGRTGKSAVSWGGKGVATAGRAALGAGKVALRAAPVAAGIGSALAGVGAAVAGVISAPVVIAGAAIAAVGTGAYYTYKYFSGKMDYLQTLRAAQYGVPGLDTDLAAPVFELEGMLKDKVDFSDPANPRISSKLDLPKVLKLFGVDPEDKAHLERFVLWFAKRFKPVFIQHMALARKYAPGKDFTKLDDEMPDGNKPQFAKATMFKGEQQKIYGVADSPWEGVNAQTDMRDIREALTAILNEFDDEYIENKRRENTGTSTAPGALAAVRRKATSSQAAKDAGIDTSKGKPDSSFFKKLASGAVLAAQKFSPTAMVDDTFGEGFTQGISDGIVDKLGIRGAGAGFTSAVKDALGFSEEAKRVSSVEKTEGAEIEPWNKDSKGKPITDSTPKQEADRKRFYERRARAERERVVAAAEPNYEGTKNTVDTSDIKAPAVVTDFESFKALASQVAVKLGVDPSLLTMLAKASSQYNSTKRDGGRAGLFSYDPATWRDMMDRHAERLGIDVNAKPTDPKAATLIAAARLSDQLREVSGFVKDPAQLRNALYLSHVYGPKKVRDLYASDGNVNIANVLKPSTAYGAKLIADREGALSKDELLTKVSSLLNGNVEDISGRTFKVTSAPSKVDAAEQYSTLQVSKPNVATDVVEQSFKRRKSQEERVSSSVEAKRKVERVSQNAVREEMEVSNTRELITISNILSRSYDIHFDNNKLLRNLLEYEKLKADQREALAAETLDVAKLREFKTQKDLDVPDVKDEPVRVSSNAPRSSVPLKRSMSA